MIYRRYGKRMLDILGSASALILLSPVLLILTLIVLIRLGRPCIFRQARPGMNEQIFTLCKFRTMAEILDSDGRYLPDAQRQTRLGTFLRSTSLDELPELWNILRGDMSFVGPRPLLVEYLPLYSESQKRRHEVRPGLTGLAQVNGRNAVQWEDRFNLDLQYIANITLRGDLDILWRTLFVALRRDGIHADGHTTMKLFEGSPHERI